MLQFVVIAAIILAGWYAASTFSTAVLVVGTVLGVLFWFVVMKDIKGRGLDGVTNILILTAIPIFFTSVWVFWYFVNDFEFVGQFLHRYILR